MSKSLEKEYKEHIQMETPDLWDRIEKEIQSSSDFSVEKVKKSRKRNIRKWATYGSLVAAALVVIVVLPFLNGGMKSSETTSDMYVTDTAGSTVAKDNMAFASEDAVNMEMEEAAAEMPDNGEDFAVAEEAEAVEGVVESTVAGENGGVKTVEAVVTIMETGMTEEGICLYFGVTESGEVYSFVVAGEAEVRTENLEDGELIVGERYFVKLVEDGERYRVMVVGD